MEQHFGDFKEKGKGRCGGTCYVRWYVRTGTFALLLSKAFRGRGYSLQDVCAY